MALKWDFCCLGLLRCESIRYELLCGLPMELLRYLATYGLASRIGYELHGWRVEFLRHSADMWYKAVWRASGTPEAFSYVGCESVHCGAIWEADELPMYLAMKAGHLDQVCCYVAGQ